MTETSWAWRLLKAAAIVLVVLMTALGVALVGATLGGWLQTIVKSLVEPSETLYNASGQFSLQWILSTAARPLLLLLILAILLKTLWSEWRTARS